MGGVVKMTNDVEIKINGEVKVFKGDDLTCPVQQAILFLKEQERDYLDEQVRNDNRAS